MKEKADNIKTVGLIGNPEKTSCAGVVRRAASLIQQSGRRVIADEATAKLTKRDFDTRPSIAQVSSDCDLLVVFGGDGTMLRVARDVAGQTPILGVNTGSLGFLTAVSAVDMPGGLKKVWRGEFKLESRDLLKATGTPNGKKLNERALNDFVISRGSASRLIELEVRVDGQSLTSYRCDGLIISSPTGSTAYALAAGGAVVFPTAEVLELTPICPHTLSNRSLIAPLSSTIDVKVVTVRPETILSADGQVVTELCAGDILTIKRASRPIQLVHMLDSSFAETLRHKLHWRGATF